MAPIQQELSFYLHFLSSSGQLLRPLGLWEGVDGGWMKHVPLALVSRPGQACGRPETLVLPGQGAIAGEERPTVSSSSSAVHS